MSKTRSDTMREIRRDLIETMRRIEEKGEHRVLVDRQWMEILAAHPREEKKDEQIGAEEKKNENIVDNHEKVENENGSSTAIEPLLSQGPSRVASSILSVDVKSPEKIASLVASLKKLQAVCRSFESVLSGVLPLSETCVANNKNDGEEKIETVTLNASLLEFLEEFYKEMSPAVSKESVVPNTDSWISWLPRPMVDHLDGKLLAKSESAIVQEPETPTHSTNQSLISSSLSLCDCHICLYLNGWSTSSIEIDKATEKSSADCSCKFWTNGSLTSLESSVLTTDKFGSKDSFYVYDNQSNVVTKQEEMKSRKRPVEPCPSDCSCKVPSVVTKKIKFNENSCKSQDSVTQVSSWTTSGYMADSETASSSEIKLGCTCTASTISMPVAPPTTLAIEAINQPLTVQAPTATAIEAINQLLTVQAPTAQTFDQARQFLEHKKALWTLLFIVCGTGIKVADEALRELDGDC